MRRPPDRNGHPAGSVMSDRDVDSSNATLNTLFGGSRQKSWMMGPGSPVRPTPRRPSTTKASLPSVSPVDRSGAVLPSPAPSDEPSPATTSLSPTQAHRYGGSEVNAEIPDRLGQMIRNEINQQPQTSAVARRIPQSNPQPPSVPQQWPIVVENPPLPDSVLLPSTTPETRTASLRSPSPLEDNSNYILQLNLGDGYTLPVETGDNRPAQTLDAGQPTPHVVHSASELQSPGPSHATSPLGVPQTSGPQSQTQTQIQPRRPSNGPKRQRTGVPVTLILRSLIPVIDNHIQSSGGNMNLNNGLERPRFQLLRDACYNEDSFYVAMHQLFCVWDIDHSQIVRIPGFAHQNVLAVAFKILGQLIRDNDQLAPNHKRWFASFPGPLLDLLSTSGPYKNAVTSVGIFLSKLATEWSNFSKTCSARGYPPLVDELVNKLYILSPSLQGVVFTASRRNLGVTDEEMGSAMEDLFQKDRQSYYTISARVNTSQAPTGKEIADRNANLALAYANLLKKAMQRRISSVTTPSAASPLSNNVAPTLATNVPSSSNPGVHSPAIVPSTNESYSAFPGGNTNGSGYFPSQLLPTTSGSPNPGSASSFSRPSSVNANRLSHSHATSTSPVPVQSPYIQYLGSQNGSISPGLQNNMDMGTNMTQHHTIQGPMVPGYRQNDGNVRSQDMRQQQTILEQHAALEHQNHPASLPQQNDNRPESTAQFRQTPGSYVQRPQANPPHVQRPQSVYQGPNTRFDGQNSSNVYNVPTYSSRTQPTPLARQSTNIAQRQMQHGQHTHSRRSSGNAGVTSVTHGPSNLAMGVPARNNPLWQIQQQPLSFPHPIAPQVSNNQRHILYSNRSNNSTAPAVQHPQRVGSISLLQTAPIQSAPPSGAQDPYAYLNRPFIPPIGYNHQPQEFAIGRPEITGLHQSNLRSPHLLPLHRFPEGLPADHADRRFYQIVKGFVYKPERISSSRPISVYKFTIPEQEYKLIAKSQTVAHGKVDHRKYTAGTLQYRLRCVRKDRDQDECSLEEWVVSETAWPDNGCFEIQVGDIRQQLEIRRKNHHGKNLPIDITRFLDISGPSSKITLSIPGKRLSLSAHNYLLAIERIEILAHKQIMKFISEHHHISSNETLEGIKRSLSGPNIGEDDDDISVVSSDLSINLADPFSARIVDIPVRGPQCLHRECFDLETFLLSRPSKTSDERGSNQPSMVDVWKCPLCGKDARPYGLYIDDFIAGVRTELERMDRLDVRAIWINKEGKWRPKEEPKSRKRKGPPDSDSSDDENEKEQVSKAPSKRTEVIELDDDDD